MKRAEDVARGTGHGSTAKGRTSDVPLSTKPTVDGRGHTFIVLAVGPEAHRIADTWCLNIAGIGRPYERIDVDDAELAGQDAALASRVEGLLRGRPEGRRLMVAGPGHTVDAVLTAAQMAGLDLDAVRAAVTDA